MTVTASAISGILAKAGFKRANTRTNSWSSGFEVGDFGRYVRISYTTKLGGHQLQILKDMADLINARPENKYWAAITPIAPGSDSLVVKVYAYDETDPEQNEARKADALEKLAAEHPAAPTVADVKKALRTYSQYDADFYGFGHKVERLEEDARLVRIRMVESPHATYEGDRDQHIAQTLANYARVVHEAGFEFQVRDEEMSIIVAEPGEWSNVATPATVATLLRSHYTEATAASDHAGFSVCDYRKDGDQLRVQYYPTAETLKDDRLALEWIERYARLLGKLGYDAVVAHDDTWALLVRPGVAKTLGKPQESPEEVRTALLTLRELAEADEPMYSTRTGGPDSIYVFAVSLNVQVAYSNGEYKTRGRNGRHELRRFPAVNSELLDFLRVELGL